MPGAIFIRLNFLIKHGFAEIKTIRMDSRIFFFFSAADKPSEILLRASPSKNDISQTTSRALRDYKSTGWINKSRRPMERNSNDWHGQRRKFQTFTETRIFRHVKIHEHVRWNRSFRGGKFPRGKGWGGGERYVTHKILWWKPAPPGASTKFPSSIPRDNALFIFLSFSLLF